MTRLGTAAVLAVGMLTVSACGGGPEAKSSGRDLVDEVCDLAFRCCSRGEINLLFGPYVDEQNCAERLNRTTDLAAATLVALPFEGAAIALPNLGVLERAVNEDRAEIDEEMLSECLTLMREMPCNVWEEEEEIEGCQPPEPEFEGPCDLDKIIIGKVGHGGDCSSPTLAGSLECQEGLACRAFDSLGVNGVCVEPGDVGEYCFSSSECLEDLYCALVDGTCQLPSAEGEVCAFSDPDDPSPSQDTLLIQCEEELSCDPVTDRCVAPCQLGARCDSEDDCDEEQGLQCILGRCDRPRPVGFPCLTTTDCQEGLRCALDLANPTRNICQELLAEGEDCSNSGHPSCASGFCDPDTLECAAASAPGGLCLSGLHQECTDGYCDSTFLLCPGGDDDCAGSGSCGTLNPGYCDPYCIELLIDGAECDYSWECASGTCLDNYCRTVPLADGQACDFDTQCASGFCGLESTRVCTSLPLDNGSACNSAMQCNSGVCHQGQCKNGLQEGDDCSSFADPPCAPGLYCENQESPPLCTVVHGPGEECDGSFQCYGACTIRHGRWMCDATVGNEQMLCDEPAPQAAE